MGREEKVWVEGKLLPVNQNLAATALPRRFFAMADTDAIELVHRDYGEQVRHYFHELFPQRSYQVLSDPVANPLPVHVEVLFPTADEPFYLLHTMGMSAAPMHCLSGSDGTEEIEKYGELCMLLPGDWPFVRKVGQRISLDDPAAWTIRLLMELGRFPHVHKLGMSYGFMLPNEENCEPFSPMTQLSGILIVQFEGNLGELHTADGTEIQLYLPFLVYKEEMDLYNEIGVDELVERILGCNDESFLLNVHRPNAALCDEWGECDTDFMEKE